MAERCPDNDAVSRVKYYLNQRGMTLSDIARKHAVSRQRVWSGIRRGSPKWKEIISNELDINHQFLWRDKS